VFQFGWRWVSQTHLPTWEGGGATTPPTRGEVRPREESFGGEGFQIARSGPGAGRPWHACYHDGQRNLPAQESSRGWAEKDGNVAWETRARGVDHEPNTPP